jgi:hypothetical protein
MSGPEREEAPTRSGPVRGPQPPPRTISGFASPRLASPRLGLTTTGNMPSRALWRYYTAAGPSERRVRGRTRLE